MRSRHGPRRDHPKICGNVRAVGSEMRRVVEDFWPESADNESCVTNTNVCIDDNGDVVIARKWLVLKRIQRPFFDG